MGTGGAVANVTRELKIQENFLLANADTWLGTGIKSDKDATWPALAAVGVANTGRYGRLEIDSRGYIQSFLEKNTDGASGHVNAGLYQLSPILFENWGGGQFSL